MINHNIPNYGQLSSSRGFIRHYLIFELMQQNKEILPDEVVKTILSRFNCKAIIIAQMTDLEHKKECFHYRIGIHSIDASKHTYKKTLHKSFLKYK